jgi:hypothetical protein
MLQNSIFVVGAEPYCIWEVDIADRNREFLWGIDTEYFNYLLNVHLNAEDEKRAAIALRATLHHAMETMFSLLGAYIQAPHCVYAWIAKCSNTKLRKIVTEINNGSSNLHSPLGLEGVTWESVSESIFRAYGVDSEKKEKTSQLFANLWQRLAHEYTNVSHIDEYNSIKHGFRVRSGGFSFSVGLEHEYGVPPPHTEMNMVGASEYGTTFFKVETIGALQDNRSLKSTRKSLNWRVEKVSAQLQLVYMSIVNIVSALKVMNGEDANECQFLRPSKDTDFENPWLYSTGVTNMSMDFVINAEDVKVTTKKELIEIINKHSDNS